MYPLPLPTVIEGELRAEFLPDSVILLALALDLRRRLFLNTRLILFPALAIDPEPELSESVLSDELESLDEDEDEEFIMSWRRPGCDSSSMMA